MDLVIKSRISLGLVQSGRNWKLVLLYRSVLVSKTSVFNLAKINFRVSCTLSLNKNFTFQLENYRRTVETSFFFNINFYSDICL